jgi:malate dehydrogenase (quinone)
MTKVGIKEYPLVEYLAGQLMLSDEDRLNALKEYFPNAKAEDWRLWQAGQRVQIIKRDEAAGGVLKLGTEIVAAQDGTIAGLLGASPGASTAAPIMLSVLQKVFKDKVATPEWQEAAPDRAKLRHPAEQRSGQSGARVGVHRQDPRTANASGDRSGCSGCTCS